MRTADRIQPRLFNQTGCPSVNLRLIIVNQRPVSSALFDGLRCQLLRKGITRAFIRTSLEFSEGPRPLRGWLTAVRGSMRLRPTRQNEPAKQPREHRNRHLSGGVLLP